MAYSNNLIVLLGNVGNDPKISQFSDGNIQAYFSLATTESYKPKDSEEWVEQTDWHTVRAYGSAAKTIANYVRKGHKLEVVGKLKNNNYEKDGVKHYGYYIKVEKLVLLEDIKGKFEALAVEQVQGTPTNSENEDMPF
ncbi:single-stranded DNA-binding protein [Volucribacter amazonae]|uniref:Single-stranded DNA-binding protein n=1 Tax=Volucribacter amazonae TaxID=256731 RepID=A0A9X4PEY1_9PAST|nr:single-stranded DNA-binding protein [Volucribacter amazonae]MDG6896409.1 single-stranded DNA-binding protein [Volucribacter amazonae]